MKKTVVSLLLLAMVITGAACKKTAEDQAKSEIVNAMTDGIWYISKFTEGGTNITSGFTGWEIQFYDNGTCQLRNSASTPSTVNAGWVGNPSDFTFTATFTTTPPAPLQKMGGVWLVTRAASSSQGSFAKKENNVDFTMDLTKK